MRILLILVAVLSLGAQETPLPASHYCQNHPPRKNETRAHECHCDYVCDIDGDIHESSACKMYCRKQACTCWPEAPCPKPS